MDLIHKIQSRQASVMVVGLGYVGLPLAVAFAESGLHVTGIELNLDRVETINAGKSYIEDIPAEKIAALVTPQEGPPLLVATNDSDALSAADVAIICVPTPLSKTRAPEMSYIVSATDAIAAHLHSDMLVVLESTTYPGTTQEVVLPRLESARGDLKVGEDFFLAFSPERIDPGRKDWTVQNTPKIIGGMTARCTEVTRALYASAIENVVAASSPMVAEMTKLLENTYRAVNIGLVNELAIMCGRLGIDVWEVIEMAKTKPFGFMPFYPGPGLGGHCIPTDPEYLAWKMKTLDYDARFIQLASEINLGMPAYVLQMIFDALNAHSKALKGSNILVIGVAYKENVSDLRDAPALDLIQLLLDKGANVFYNDPHVPRIEHDGLIMDNVALDEQLLSSMDCAVIVTPHSGYDWQWIIDKSRVVVDTRNATKNVAAAPGRVVRL